MGLSQGWCMDVEVATHTAVTRSSKAERMPKIHVQILQSLCSGLTSPA